MMREERLYDINEVCKMLGTTSRTLRFYEEKGIIGSTKAEFSGRRRYTEAQVGHIRNVIVLRTLGLSVKAIRELQMQKTALKKAVLARRAEIIASIESRKKEIQILNEALAVIESGENVFEKDLQRSIEGCSNVRDEIARECAEAIVCGDHGRLYRHFSVRLAEYLPVSVFETVRRDALEPLGEFVSIEKLVHDGEFPNAVYCFARYTKLGLRIKFVFHNDMIDGLWLSYYEIH